MAVVHFYEKPGCITNAKQKALLSQAGHVLVIHNLLQQDWQNKPDALLAFFADLAVKDWFNPNAPALKKGEINPETLDADRALALMIASPILIRRPLIEIDGQRCAGFNQEKLQHWLGLTTLDKQQGIENCSNNHHHKQGSAL